ncbi:unnamed protein product, partial [Timema podura]|nr:unnamed protein product [Timema podura]
AAAQSRAKAIVVVHPPLPPISDANYIGKPYLLFGLSFESDVARRKKMLIAFSDTILWQSFASVIIPGCTINRLCASSLYILKKTTKLPKNTRKWITTGIGLASIPFIIKPIDRLVDYSMNNSFRKVTHSDLCLLLPLNPLISQPSETAAAYLLNTKGDREIKEHS